MAPASQGPNPDVHGMGSARPERRLQLLRISWIGRVIHLGKQPTEVVGSRSRQERLSRPGEVSNDGRGAALLIVLDLGYPGLNPAWPTSAAGEAPGATPSDVANREGSSSRPSEPATYAVIRSALTETLEPMIRARFARNNGG